MDNDNSKDLRINVNLFKRKDIESYYFYLYSLYSL